MREHLRSRLLYSGFFLATALAASPQLITAQAQAADTFKCNMLHAEQMVAGSTDLTSSDSSKLTVVDATTAGMILKSGLPCDAINTDKGPAALPIANRQRGFDFVLQRALRFLFQPAQGPVRGGVANLAERPDDQALGRRLGYQ